MLFFNDKSKSLNVFFLQEHHLAMLKSYKIPFSDLPYLLFYPVPKEDILDWIKYQRSVERKYFNRAITTYNTAGDFKFQSSDIRHDLALLSPELEAIYKDNNKYYDELQFSSYHSEDGTIVILSRNNGMVENGFTMTERNPIAALYQAVLNTLGYHETYFREPVRDKDNLGIGLGEVLSILTK